MNPPVMWEHRKGEDYRTLKRKSNNSYYRIIREVGNIATGEIFYYVCERDRAGVPGVCEIKPEEAEDVTPRPKRK